MTDIQPWVYEEEQYLLTALPNKETKIVQWAQTEILGNLRLEDLITGLNQAATSIYTAYRGVVGYPELAPEIFLLHHKFREVCSESQNGLYFFSKASEAIQGIILTGMKCLMERNYKFAAFFFKQCSEEAGKLAIKAGDLVEAFDKLSTKVVDITGKVQGFHSLKEEDRKNVLRKIEDLKAESAQTQENFEGLKKQREKLDNLYQEARREASKASDRALLFSIINTITHPAEWFGGSEEETEESGQQPSQQYTSRADALKAKLEKEKEWEAANQKLTKAQGVVSAAENKLKGYKDALEGEKKETQKVRDAYFDEIRKVRDGGESRTNELEVQEKEEENQKLNVQRLKLLLSEKERTKKQQDESLKPKDETEIQNLKEELKGASEKMETARTKAEDTRRAIGNNELNTTRAKVSDGETKVDLAFQALLDSNAELREAKEDESKAKEEEKTAKGALDSAEKTLTDIDNNPASAFSENYKKIASELKKEKEKYLGMYIDCRLDEIKTLGQIATYAGEIKNYTLRGDNLQAACSSLFLAIGALKDVTATLREAHSFWQKLGMAFEDLATSGLEKNITTLKSISPEKWANFLNRDNYKRKVIEYYAKWKAIELICKEYSEKTSLLDKKFSENMTENLSIEDSQLKVQGLADTVTTEAEQQIGKVHQVIDKIKGALKSFINKFY